MKTVEVSISKEDKQILLELLEICDRILDKYSSYVTKMGRDKDGVKDAKYWCNDLKIK